ncbi:hypothetical protein TRV_01040 [Trichophyton verrucosum HKI 0517]|uniref:Probable Xaa-Pro aminopeptidase PEPP n=1 Tax=Trichophyton verrucosum (strain HKI 0517) TaxID=663202 RepID=D4D1T8_TRIVH|nr:uncharacterized protein TRV_01040 [Trichophyton verrucosum HKI 0517]EFE44190.1 hypothetical protein TRV_01040 [Trichophyton verrucosum HKI 0517]
MDINVDKYPAKSHARRVAEKLKAAGHGSTGIIFVEGQKEHIIDDSDEPFHFRQRRNFLYLSGCLEAECSVAYNIEKDELTLFIPPVDPASVMWSGLPLEPAKALKQFDVDAVLLTTEINNYLAKCGGEKVFTIADRVCPEVSFSSFKQNDTDALKIAIESCRVVKDEYEIGLLRRANEVSSQAHIEVMKAATKSKNEREFYATLNYVCMSNGCSDQSYHPILACGPNAATLHYTKNNGDLTNPATGIKDQLVLIDAGCQYKAYCADITRAFPLSGKFTTEGRQIYDIALEMQKVAFSMIKPNVLFDDMHAAVHRVAIKGLLKIGILTGSEDEIFEKGISTAFFPHGLGHHLGMDTHDVGGNPNPADPNRMFKYLRLRGTVPEGSVITIEPGVYFCRYIIEPFLTNPETSKYINTEVLDKYWAVGGVRIEDNVVVRANGFENLTTVPKEPEEVERIVQEGAK